MLINVFIVKNFFCEVNKMFTFQTFFCCDGDKIAATGDEKNNGGVL